MGRVGVVRMGREWGVEGTGREWGVERVGRRRGTYWRFTGEVTVQIWIQTRNRSILSI